VGARECAAGVAEKLGFQQGFGQRAAGNFDEGFVAAGRAMMDGAGQERFAGARFAVMRTVVRLSATASTRSKTLSIL
jgi:hypothetical protein